MDIGQTDAVQVIHFKQLMKTAHDDEAKQDIEQATDAVVQQLRLHVRLFPLT